MMYCNILLSFVKHRLLLTLILVREHVIIIQYHSLVTHDPILFSVMRFVVLTSISGNLRRVRHYNDLERGLLFIIHLPLLVRTRLGRADISHPVLNAPKVKQLSICVVEAEIYGFYTSVRL